MTMTMTLTEMRASFEQEGESELDWDDPALLVVMGGLVVGPFDEPIAEWASLDLAEVTPMAERLRANEVWGEDTVYLGEDEELDLVTITLWMMVANGMLERA